MRLSLFSAKAEYACIAMIELAARHGDAQPVRLRTIAESHSIPRRFLVQILLQLNAAGLVESVRGAAGGYRLARPPEQTTLAEIIRTIDSTKRPSRPRTSAKARKNPELFPVETSSSRVLREVWTSILDAQHKILASITLTQLVEKSQAGSDLMYQI
jgi:Rrf2 family transcriptional regulator, cysteine metabolism repressor